MTKTEITLEEANLDKHTIEYLEIVSGLKGIKAVNAWLTYTGWINSEPQKGCQRSVEYRLRKARLNAKSTKWKP